MPIPFQCPHCGHETLVDDVYAGSSGPCASCGKTVVMPSVSPYASSPPRSQKSTLFVILIIVGITGCMFLLMSCGMLMMFRVTSFEQHDVYRDEMQKMGEALEEYQDTIESEETEGVEETPAEGEVEEPTEELDEATGDATEEETVE
jgi:transcription elongation factor Elf1